MAINKVVNKSTKSHGAMRNVIEYVLRDEKVKEGYVEITGPYAADTIYYDDIYKTWLAEKRLWGKDSGRMYTHNIISFHKDENVSPAEVLDIGKDFADKFFSGHQCVIGVHQDKDHLHCHIVTNSVSYIDGMKLHQTKRDLEHQKEYTNRLCRDRGLSIAEKGHHFDGSRMEEGHVIAWSKDKYNLLLNDTKKSFVAECAIALMESIPQSCSREEFVSNMGEKGWSVQWEDKRKHIVFQNENGEKVRDSNIAKTFAMDISKEVLTHEFERQNELRLAKLREDREKAAARKRDEAELRQYYSELEAAITGTDIACEAVGGNSAADRTEGSSVTEWSVGGSEKDFGAYLAELDTEEQNIRDTVEASIRDNADERRAVIHTENQSVAHEKQSIADAEQRRLAEQRRAAIESRAIKAGRRKHSYSGPER